MKIEEICIEKLEHIPLINKELIDKYDSVVIVPMHELHDSGYKCMTFVFCKKGEAICRSFGGSDVLHLDGLGGFGNWYVENNKNIPTTIKPKGWKVDCLPSGFLRIFCSGKIYPEACCVSDFEIYGGE